MEKKKRLCLAVFDVVVVVVVFVVVVVGVASEKGICFPFCRKVSGWEGRKMLSVPETTTKSSSPFGALCRR